MLGASCALAGVGGEDGGVGQRAAWRADAWGLMARESQSLHDCPCAAE